MSPPRSLPDGRHDPSPHTPMIAVVADFPVFRDRIHGGLQRKLRSLLQAFALVRPVTLCCSAGSDLELAGCTRRSTYSSDGKLTAEGRDTLEAVCANASVVVSFEARLDFDVHCPAVLVMGGLAYEWSDEVVRSRTWTRIVVPSPFVHEKLARYGIESSVISNGYDWTEFRHTRPGAELRELLPRNGVVLGSPHRPEMVKGHLETLRLTRALLERGVDCTLLIPEQNFLALDPEFYTELRAYGQTLLPPERIVYHPWISAHRMAEYYSIVDLTLALGVVEEGFGAVAVESVGCGTPVLARARGALANLLPPDHGLYLTDCNDLEDLSSLAESVLRCPLRSRKAIMAKGRAYLEAHYNVARMASAYVGVLDEAAGVRFRGTRGGGGAAS